MTKTIAYNLKSVHLKKKEENIFYISLTQVQ